MKTLILILTALCLLSFAHPSMAQDAETSSGLASGFDLWRGEVLTWLEAAGQDHLSPVGMFMAADWVVKAVMLSLAFASLITWVIFGAKMADLAISRLRLARQYRVLDKAGSLVGHIGKPSKKSGVLGHMVRAALREQSRTGEDHGLKEGIKERVASELARIEAGAARKKGAAVGILANIGSTAPFVGLFGTVWGIMNSFISISESNTTNLAVVAPGIAEALLATAIGLVAAIPAVIFYNLITRSISGYRVMLGDAGALVERSLSRDLDLKRFETTVPEIAIAAAAE